MLQIVLRNKKGVTLVEVLIALVILLIVFLGLIQASLLSIESNSITLLRDEAVRLGSDTLTALRTSAFDDLNQNNTADGGGDADFNGVGNLPGDPAGEPAGNIFDIASPAAGPATAAERNARNVGINTRKTVRNILNANYLVSVKVNNLDADNKRITVLVQWDWKERTLAGGNPYSHRIVALLRRI